MQRERTPRVGRRFVLGFEGTRLPDDLVAFARRFGLGGVILFRRNCPDAATVAALCDEIHRRVGEADPCGRPLVYVDQEGGRVERIHDGVPRLPPAAQLGRGGPVAVEAAAREQAAALAALGIDVNLAPVCDVVQEGESGAIGDRSFGGDPVAVAELAAAWVRGSLSGGVLPCAKHFPGHGAAKVDSHRGLPRVDKSRQQWASVDRPPFQAAVAAGVPLVMAAHVCFPAIHPEPATLAAGWLGEELRGGLGFRGAVISDDLEMGALAGLGSPEEVAMAALAAGCDRLIYGRMLRPDLAVEPIARRLQREQERTDDRT
ncbi:MAG: beta-N-acetylhexosaminidase [Deltaproteobacteria bacterium]|nr:beta-N-acetylhexosaminidase [Deltaproteobacteria bacterium]